MGCSYCGKSCGSREFCNETCYDEYQENLKVFQESRDDLPGETYWSAIGRYLDPEPKEVFPW